MSLTALHEQALQLILLNPGNACYMNALIQVMVWLVTIDTLSVTSLASATGRFYLSLFITHDWGPSIFCTIPGGSRGLKVGQRFIDNTMSASSSRS